jgi:hypothetical protein
MVMMAKKYRPTATVFRIIKTETETDTGGVCLLDKCECSCGLLTRLRAFWSSRRDEEESIYGKMT